MSDRMTILKLFAAVTVAALFGGSAIAEEKPLPKGSAVLTVAGKTANWNRGAMAPERDNLMKQRAISFERAMAFDWEMLASLPQQDIRVVTPAGDGTYSGPLLADVLQATGATGGKVRLLGLDGSDTELKFDDVKAENWILALVANGKPVGIGDFGPLWLMRKPASGQAPSKEEMERWVWSVFYIEVL